MWIERTLGSELKKLAATFPVVVITGPRQVGKTSLLERTFPSHRYLSLDDAQNAEAAESRPLELLASFPPPLIIDEIQYAPSLLRYLKVAVDRRRGENGLFLITGSQSFPMMQAVSESLAGRAAVIPFLGLSAEEWAASARVASRSSHADLLWRGGYPGLWADPESPPDRDRWYQGYVATYLERDVRNMLNVSRLRDFERFLRACAIRNGQLLNMSEIGRDVGISPTTAREWMGVLHASAQVALLEPYHRNLGKRLVKSPKLYFTDTGLASFLCGFQSPAALAASPLAGAFWENHVICQWLRWRDWRAPAAGLWFWQDRMKNEVDLVVELDGRLHPVECKRKERPDPSDLKGMHAFRSFYTPREVGPAWIACLAERRFEVAPGITAVNGWTTWPLGQRSGR
jgi:predicted AAA+ superfamily ATPase